jgi:RNA polymerase sigma factor (sigma-70 family)
LSHSRDIEDAREAFLKNRATIQGIVEFVCRKNRVNATAAEDFASEVNLALITDDYDIIRKFEGRSSFSTYLTTVIQRLFYQHRVKEWGKWRPSAEAKRLGQKAITIEKLLTRDGYSFGEACQFLTTGNGPEYTKLELEAIYMRLPPRQPRPLLVSEDASADAVPDSARADDALLGREREHVARKVAALVDREMARLGADDQLLLRMRFWEGRKAPEIASALHIDQKKVYKRLDKLFLGFKKELERAGIPRAEIDELLATDHHEMAGNTDPGPSDPPDGIGGGAGRLPG